MPYIANMITAKKLVNAKQLAGDGQCVAFVHAVTSIPATVAWRRGEKVEDTQYLPVGTIIATFDDNGRYGNHTNGTSHAAVYLYKTQAGIVVLDQWKGHGAGADHVPQQRTIHSHGFSHVGVDQATNYYVVQ